jgi:hypothetical protein
MSPCAKVENPEGRVNMGRNEYAATVDCVEGNNLITYQQGTTE